MREKITLNCEDWELKIEMVARVLGKGKGTPEYWVAVVKPGTILFELDGLSKSEAFETFRKCSNKLPLKTKVVPRRPL